MSRSKLLAVGIDGACWPLIDQWIDEGLLPNIKALRDEGMWGTLESTIPPVTCPAWKCYSTGKNPGKLGAFWWENLDIEKQESFIPNSTSFESKELWDLLNENGWTTGVVGMPLTYPPKEVDGFMISGGPGTPDTGFTYPSKIESELKDKYDYTPRPSYPSSTDDPDARETFVEESLRQIESEFGISEYLYRKESVDFLQVTSFEINGPLQHLFYDDTPTRQAWQTIDKKIGELSEHFDYVLIHSDHGTSKMDRQFFVNVWLSESGFLERNRKWTEKLADWGLYRENIIDLLDKLGLADTLRNVDIARKIARRIPDSKGLFGEAEGAAIFEKVDWERTQAVGLAQGPIYLNKQTMDEGEYDEVREAIISGLKSLKDPATGQSPIQEVYRKEEIYTGEYVEKAPDIVALDAPRYHNKGGIGKTEMFADSHWRGNNSRDGLYAISGPDIDNQRKDGEIYDLAPTILDLFGTPIPEDVDGRSLLGE